MIIVKDIYGDECKINEQDINNMVIECPVCKKQVVKPVLLFGKYCHYECANEFIKQFYLEEGKDYNIT